MTITEIKTVPKNNSKELTNYVVRRAQPSDKPQIADIFEKAYPNRSNYKYPERWNWQFVNNTFVRSTKLPIWFALHQEKIVGQTAALIEPIYLNGQIRTAGWSVDTFVLPEHRGQGLGHQLQAINQEEHDLFLSLSMSSANRHIKKKLGAVPLPTVPIFRLRLAADSTEVKQRFFSRLKISQQGRLLNWLAKFAADCYSKRTQRKWLRQHRSKIRMISQWAVEQVDQFPEEVNQLWDNVASHYGLIVRRDADYLNWKFCDQPHVTYRKYIFREQEEIRGVLILREGESPEPRVGLVVELFTAPEEPELITAMISYAIESFIKQSMLTVKIIASTETHQCLYEELGFKKLKELSPVCYFKPGLHPPEKPAYFSLADQDLDQYPLATL